MCHKDRCFFCIPVEHGCLAFGILSAIVSALGLLGSIIIGILFYFEVILSLWPEPYPGDGLSTRDDLSCMRMWFHTMDSSLVGNPDVKCMKTQLDTAQLITDAQISDEIAKVVVWSAVLAGTLAFLVAFIFSVLLCNGICKRKPEQVNAYKNYGLNITVGAILLSLIAVFIADSCITGILGLFGCLIYLLFLELVDRTYQKLRTDAVFKDPV